MHPRRSPAYAGLLMAAAREGEGFSGLRSAGDIDRGIAAADEALRSGSAE